MASRWRDLLFVVVPWGDLWVSAAGLSQDLFVCFFYFASVGLPIGP